MPIHDLNIDLGGAASPSTRWGVWEINTLNPAQEGRWAQISRPAVGGLDKRSATDFLMGIDHATDAWISYTWTGTEAAARAKASVWNVNAAKGIYYEARPFI